jgi:hypothetical protein
MPPPPLRALALIEEDCRLIAIYPLIGAMPARAGREINRIEIRTQMMARYAGSLFNLQHMLAGRRLELCSHFQTVGWDTLKCSAMASWVGKKSATIIRASYRVGVVIRSRICVNVYQSTPKLDELLFTSVNRVVMWEIVPENLIAAINVRAEPVPTGECGRGEAASIGRLISGETKTTRALDLIAPRWERRRNT